MCANDSSANPVSWEQDRLVLEFQKISLSALPRQKPRNSRLFGAFFNR